MGRGAGGRFAGLSSTPFFPRRFGQVPNSPSPSLTHTHPSQPPLETHHSTPPADRSRLRSWQPRSGQGSGRRGRPRPGCPTGAPDPLGGSRFPFPARPSGGPGAAPVELSPHPRLVVPTDRLDSGELFLPCLRGSGAPSASPKADAVQPCGAVGTRTGCPAVAGTKSANAKCCKIGRKS